LSIILFSNLFPPPPPPKKKTTIEPNGFHLWYNP
jgi:hypothetical protein